MPRSERQTSKPSPGAAAVFVGGREIARPTAREKKSRKRPFAFFLALASIAALHPARADDVPVAVAANFSAPMKRIAAAFERETGYRARVSTGSTGNLYAQIRNGAPFQVFLAADEKTPAALEAQSLAVAGTRFTYAVGKLALWSAKPGFVDNFGGVLRRGDFGHLAIANPKLAPYGAAAIETMRRLGVWAALEPKIVRGENVAQTWQFVASGNAELGFVALSQVVADGMPAPGSTWVVPKGLYRPIRQDAVLLARGDGKPAAAALLRYLKSAPARAIIKSFGYDL